MSGMFSWKLVHDGKTPPPGAAVGPRERMSWGRTIGIGAQHIVAMFGGMLVANAAGLLALRGEKRLLGVSLAALVLLALGGLVLGPLVQKAAFGAYWTGWPFGTDLTDNKTAVAVLAWGVAAFRARGGRSARLAVGVAALVTLAVFLVPHSAWGSQIDWSKLPAGGGS